jgi:uncharacterized protein (DUF2267 family)
MSATGLEIFDRTLQSTNIWLDEINEEVGPDRQVAWRVLGAVLHVLRDRLSVELAAHLGAQLPLLVRGLYYDQYRPAQQPGDVESAQDFTEAVAGTLADIRPIDPGKAVAAVFGVLSRHLSQGLVENVRQALPHGIRKLWPDPAALS